jgi:hypothetical protein
LDNPNTFRIQIHPQSNTISIKIRLSALVWSISEKILFCISPVEERLEVTHCGNKKEPA